MALRIPESKVDKKMHVIQNDKNIIQVFLHGKLNQNSLFDAQKDLMLHPEYAHKNSLWHFDKDFVCDFSNAGMADLISRIKLFYPTDATKQKAALLATSSMHYAILQLFCDDAEIEGLPFRFRAFQSHEKADAWLNEF